MTSVFADSSALVKLYADEDGHEQVRALETVLVSQLARVEVPAAIWRKQRTGEIPPPVAAVLVAAFEADFYGSPGEPARFVVLGVPQTVLESAARLTGVHGLAAYDAVQLATACAAAGATGECRTFAAFDSRLRTAAAAEGFRLLPAE